MYQQKGIQISLRSIITPIFSNQFNLAEKFEGILIYMFLTSEEILELKEFDQNRSEILFVGESLVWEYGSKNNSILEEFESYNLTKQRKPGVFTILSKIIKLFIKSIYLYFYIDELFMDGYLQTEPVVCYNDQFHSRRKILFAPSSRMCSICKWYNILPLKFDKTELYSIKYKLHIKHKLNYYFRSFSDYYEFFPEYLFKYPIAYGVRE